MRSSSSARDGARRRYARTATICLALCCLAVPTFSGICRAQVVFALQAAPATAPAEEDGKKKYLFTFPTQSNDIREAIDDFQRYVGRSAWEKAFQSLDTARKAPEGKLITGSDRFSLPI